MAMEKSTETDWKRVCDGRAGNRTGPLLQIRWLIALPFGLAANQRIGYFCQIPGQNGGSTSFQRLHSPTFRPLALKATPRQPEFLMLERYRYATRREILPSKQELKPTPHSYITNRRKSVAGFILRRSGFKTASKIIGVLEYRGMI